MSEYLVGGATDTRAVHIGTGLVAAVSGLAAVAAPPDPTGRPLVDAVLVGVSVALVTGLAALAPWGLLVALGAIAVAVGVAPVPMALGAVGLLLAFAPGWYRRQLPPVAAAAAGFALNALARAEVGLFFGFSAIVGVGLGVVLFVAGGRRLPKVPRRLVWSVAGVVVLIGVVGTVATLLGGSSARDDLAGGRAATRRGIDAFDDGDFELAATEFDAASAALADGRDALGSPFARIGGVVPVVAQHREALGELARTGADATTEVAAALRQIDPESLRITDGRIDLAAIAGLSTPFHRVDDALDEMRVAVAGFGSPWILDGLTDAVASLDAELAEQAPRLDDAVEAIDLAPRLLGAGGTRTYLALFTTPSEARGLGGFIGNYAQIDIVDGAITMPRFGRVSDLELIDATVGTTLTGPQEFLDRYGVFGYDAAGDGRVGDASWRNLTMTPHMPWVGEVAVQLYRQEAGVELDGIIVIDPYVVQAFLAYTGPIELSEIDVRLNERNAAEFLLKGQYELSADRESNETRIDALEEAGRLTFDRILAGNLPDPVQLARDLGPLVEDRRLLVWSAHPDEQPLLERVGLLGNMPVLDGADGWSFALTNGGGNKIDAFLSRAASYESQTDPATGETTATMTVELTNGAPSTGLPGYVIGNSVGLPDGTSRLLVSFYSPLGVETASLDGQPLSLVTGQEAGWGASTAVVEIPAGDTVTIVVELRGRVEDPDRLVTWEQPLVTDVMPAG